MKDQRSPTHYLLRKVLFVLLLTGTLIHFTRIAMAQQEPNDRPRRSEGQDRGQGRGREGGGGGGGRREMAENKTPTSPNPGQTVGLFLNTPKACNGYTLFAPKHNTVTYLIDNDGRIVHQWKSAYEPGQSAYLLPNGHLLRAGMLRVQGGTGGGEGGRLEEYDWDGNLVWEFNHATRDYQLHHDIKPLPNGHILALMVERKSREETIAAGFDARLLRDEFLVPDAVVEIEPILPKGGRIVWEWHVWDHLIQNSDRTKPNYGDVAAHPELIDVACNGRACLCRGVRPGQGCRRAPSGSRIATPFHPSG
ncbi:MAG: aryl-sulfate sulfotransferase [Verrucomicrobia bacterium]|nr:aryl-sulfate sulfotransferase [Verrucomicrobiota bacterium]